jgi:hypothetical protein
VRLGAAGGQHYTESARDCRQVVHPLLVQALFVHPAPVVQVRRSTPRVRIAPNDGRGYSEWEQNGDAGLQRSMQEQHHDHMAGLTR